MPVISPRAAKGFWLLSRRDLEGLLEKLRLQFLEPWGDVEPAQLRERSNGWPCLSFSFGELTPSQLCCLRYTSWPMVSPSPSKGSRGLGVSALPKGQHSSIWHPIKGR